MRDPAMPKIEDYALLGDLHTAALVSTAGSVDWLCLPRFDSPAAFAAILHNDEAGRWILAPLGASNGTNRRYAGNTLVLETDWVTVNGAVRVIDSMPPRAGTPHLIRIAVGLDGEVAMRSVLRLRFDYGRVVTLVGRVRAAGLSVAAVERELVGGECSTGRTSRARRCSGRSSRSPTPAGSRGRSRLSPGRWTSRRYSPAGTSG